MSPPVSSGSKTLAARRHTKFTTTGPIQQVSQTHSRQQNKMLVNGAATKSQQRSRGSLSSCSSSSPDLSGTEEAEYYCNYYTDGSVNCSLGVFGESADESTVFCGQCDEPTTATGEAASRNKQVDVEEKPVAAARTSLREPAVNRPAQNKLHSRSISLIVNPHFDCSSEEEEPQQQQPGAKYKRARSNMGTQEGAKSLHRRQASQSAVRRENFCEADFLRLEQLKRELEGAKRQLAAQEQRLTEDECARLREIGFFLRQVSEEFARNRRLTI